MSSTHWSQGWTNESTPLTGTILSKAIRRAPKYTTEQLDSIDSENAQIAWKATQGHIKQFVCKMAVDQLATGRYMKRMSFWASDKCPQCLQTNETTNHVLQCQELSAMQLMVKLRTRLRTKLRAFPTNSETLNAIDHLLLSASWNSEPQTSPNPTTQKLLEAQLTLPPIKFAKG